MRHLLALGALAGVIAGLHAQAPLVIPTGHNATEGASSTAYPWGRAAAVIHVQYCYDSSHFTGQGISAPMLINRLKWRANSTTTAYTGGSYSNVLVDMSTASVDQAALTTTFASNHGPDRTNVYSGTVTVLPTPGVPTTTPLTPSIYYVDIPLATPFLYDPTSGNDLLIDVAFPAASWTGGTAPALDCATTNCLVSRMYNLTSDTAATGSFQASVGPVVEVGYTPASGLYPAFSATPRSGPLNTVVQFTDNSYSSDPGGVIAWQWDFNGDSVVDSTLQNPSFTYTSEGIFNVSLSVVDATHGLQTHTENAYISIDAVDASFTATVLTGTTVQFTDTSTGGPTSWNWDFDGDSVIDSTLQNPVFTYPSAGSYQVTLSVADAISTDTESINVGVGIIPMPGFGSTYSSATSTRGVWFQTPVRFSIVSLQVPDESAHGLQNVAVYRLAGAPPAYSASATGGLEFLQIGVPSSQTIPCALSFDANEFVGLIAACGDSTTMRTSYATPAGPFNSSILGQPVVLTRLLTQTNLVTTMGTAPYSSEATGNIGRVNIGISSCVGLAYGTGTPSGAGPQAPSLQTTALPFIGQNAQLTIDNGDTNALGLLALGIGRANVPTPVGTILVGNIGATFLVNGGVPMNAGQYTFNVPVPNNPSLNGVGPFTWQNINLLIGTNMVAMSNGQEWWLAQ